MKRDRMLFEKLLAKDFLYTEDDKLITRARVLEGVNALTDTVSAAHNDYLMPSRSSAR